VQQDNFENQQKAHLAKVDKIAEMAQSQHPADCKTDQQLKEERS